MFQFPPSASPSYFTWKGIQEVASLGVSPFGHARVNALKAAHRALSWPDTVLLRQHVPRHPPRALSRLSLVLSSFPFFLFRSSFFAYSQASFLCFKKKT